MSTSTAHVATWLEHRVHASLSFHLTKARLYGVVVNDPHGLVDGVPGAARSSFLGESGDVYSLLRGPLAILARSFDAAAIVTTGWAAPLDDVVGGSRPPSRHPDRRRVRVVAAVDDNGVASVLRFADDPDHPVVESGDGFGDAFDALRGVWSPGPTTPAPDLVNARTTRGACARHP